jgi:3-oxoadipate enol-lactonase
MQVYRDGRHIQYEIAGQGDEAVVFIHALGATGDMWKPQVEAFSRRFLVMTYDAGGHYREADGSARLTLQDRVSDLTAVLDAVGVTAVHVVGLSMGGMIAQLFGLTHPERVKSLVLASTTAGYPADGRRQLEQRADLVEANGTEPILDPTMERWFTVPFRERHREVVAWVRDMLGSADARAYAAAARAVAATDTLNQLDQIRAPTLILSGEDDPSMPPESARALESRIPGARRRLLSGVAHLCNVEDSETFNREVLSFITEVTGAQDSDSGLEAPVAPW